VYRPAIPVFLTLAAVLAAAPPAAVAAPRSGTLAPAAGSPVVCRRPPAGSLVSEPPALFSRGGALNVDLDYVSSTDEADRKLFCFVTADGRESPTLHVRPGDTLNIHLTNRVAASPAGKAGGMAMSMDPTARCAAAAMDATSVNVHFHGVDTPPTCHGDEVVHTLINSGESFDYHVKFSNHQTPGLYWYHPHVHGQSEQAVKGGASGAIVVDGLENLQPIVAGLPERTLIVRDQTVAGDPTPGGVVPTSDVTLNYVPIAYPALTPATIAIRPGQREFWRVLNASAETVLDIALVYDGIDQPLDVVGLDGVPTSSRDGTSMGGVLTRSHLLIPAAGRAEFIVSGPTEKVRSASLVTRSIAMGPDGDNDTARTLARLVTDGSGAAASSRALPKPSAPAPRDSPDPLGGVAITARRSLYVSETSLDPYDPASKIKYFITVDGATAQTFDPANLPAIVTTEGAVEEWTIENRSREMHEFHIHQIHFKLATRNGAALPADQQQYLDTTEIPFWTGTGPYPSITVLVDFRGVTGDLLYHCHMLDHEDGGMMAIVRVLPRRGTTREQPGRSSTPALVEERGAKAG
jgi:FtsP/CotA-like multicopper oxidase with cupredoxin domain